MSRTGENIYKRKDGRWEARYIDSYDGNGKAKYKYLYAPTYTEVKAKLLKAQNYADLSSDLGQFTRNYTQTVKRAADNKRRYAPGEGSIPPVLLSGVSKGVPPLAHDFACKV